MSFGSIPPGLERPYTFGFELRQKSRAINKQAQSLKLSALQEQYKVYKSLGNLGAKGLVNVSKRANQLAKQTLSPLEYAQSRGKNTGGGLFSFRLDV